MGIQGPDEVLAPDRVGADRPAAASASGSSAGIDPRWQRRVFLAGIVVALIVAGVIRARWVLAADFPLNDGALFSVMIDALRQHRLALPPTVAYNGLELPFAYPPLAFVVAALLGSVGVSTLDILRIVPLLTNLATVAAFALLAITVLRTGLAAALATLIYVVLPGSYVWQIMGGGLTRSFGLCFAFLALTQAYLLATRGGLSRIVLLGVLAGLTALSHLEMAWFLALGTACILLAYGRRRSTLVGAGLAAMIAALVASPWWLLIVSRHGLGPLLAAGQTGSLITSPRADQSGAAIDPGALAVVLILLALFVGMVMLGDPRGFVLGTLGVLFLADTRSFPWLSTPVFALALGAFAASAFLWLRPVRLFAGEADRPTGRPRRLSLADGIVSGLTLSIVLTTTYFLNAGEIVALTALSHDERAAMAWAAASTAPAARFVVLSGDPWSIDRSSEWFPVLAQRVSIATPQGTEWLPERQFATRLAQHTELQKCAVDGLDCIAEWARANERPYDLIYVADRRTGKCCATLRAALETDPRYTMVYGSPGAAIFAPR